MYTWQHQHEHYIQNGSLIMLLPVTHLINSQGYERAQNVCVRACVRDRFHVVHPLERPGYSTYQRMLKQDSLPLPLPLRFSNHKNGFQPENMAVMIASPKTRLLHIPRGMPWIMGELRLHAECITDRGADWSLRGAVSRSHRPVGSDTGRLSLFQTTSMGK